MNAKTLLSAIALVVFLSCQNQPDAPSAPQVETGSLALRVVSGETLAQVESVSVRLSWGADITLDRKAIWSAPSIKLEGLPLGVRIAVRMEGWNTVRGRKLVLWSGDTAVQLGGDADWNIADPSAPILIRSADSASIAAPDPNLLLPQGAVVVNDTLKRPLVGGGFDTIRLGTAGVDTVYVNGEMLGREGSTHYKIVVGSGQVNRILVVGENGMAATFHVYAYTQIASSASVLARTSPQASWNQDTVSYTLKDGASETIRIDTAGVDTLVVDGGIRKAAGPDYEVVIDKPDTFVVVAKGANGQSRSFTVRVRAAEKVDLKPGLGASLSPLPEWIGSVCSLRVRIDSGDVDSVVLVKPAREAFEPAGDGSWKLDWETIGDSARLEIHVYGTGTEGPDTVIIPSRHAFDRKGPTIRIDGARVVGRTGGALSWRATDDRGVASSWATSLGEASLSCPLDDSCRVTGLLRTFTVYAKDKLGNQTDSLVTIVVDSVGPRLDTVYDAATDARIKAGDTLWVASDTAKAGVRVVARDAVSGFQIRAFQVGREDTLSSNVSALSGLGKGTWNLLARDNLGNGTSWGKLVVAVRVDVVETKPGLKARLLLLPTWVGASCSVKVLRDSGSIDSIVGGNVKFVPDADKEYWSGLWMPSKQAGSDTLKILVHGQGSKGRDSLSLAGFAAIDRAGPTITQKSVLRNGALRVGRSGGELAVSVQDPRGVDSVWLEEGGSIARTSGDSLHRAVVKQTRTVVARDSLGNVHSLEVTVVTDSTAPSNVFLEDGLETPLGSGSFVHRDSLTGMAKLVVKATDSSGFLVRLKSGSNDLRIAGGVNGVATLDSLPAGNLTVVIEDSVGNTFVRNGAPTWGDVVVRIRPPTINKAAGTYGAEATQYRSLGYWVDVLPIGGACPDGGAAYLKTRDDTATVGWKTAPTNIFGSAAWDFRCVKGADTSEIVTRTYNVLQRPSILQDDTTFAGTSIAVGIALSSNATANPAKAEIQYCLGDSLACVAATWSTYTNPVVVRTSATLWARVAYEGKYSHAVKRTYTKSSGEVAWSKTFSRFVPVKNADALRSGYQIDARSVAGARDTLSAQVGTNTDYLRLDMKWQVQGRPTGIWGGIFAEFWLDSVYSGYDLSGADSIVFDYWGAGTMEALNVIPFATGVNEFEDLQYFESIAVPPSTSRHVSIDLRNNLKYPSWVTPGTNTWSDINGSINSILFSVGPKVVDGNSAIPKEASTTICIRNVTIYGAIRKK